VSLRVLQTREEWYIAVLCGLIDLHMPNWSWYVEYHEGGYEYGSGYVIEMIKLGVNLVIKLKM